MKNVSVSQLMPRSIGSWLRALPVALLMLMGSALSSARPVVAEEAPLRFAVTDIEGLEELQRDFGTFLDTLKAELGRPVEFYPLSSRTLVVEALRNKRVDFVLTGPSEYIVIQKRAQATPLVRFSRPDYYSCLVVKNDRSLVEVTQLKGKKVAFGDVGSTAYHLGPMQMIQDAGLNPQRDIRPVHIAKRVAWEALKRGDVDALGIKCAQFALFRDEDETVEAGEFRVIERGPDLPDDVLIGGSHLSEELRSKVKAVFSEKSDQIIAAILKGEGNAKYKGMKFLADVSDADYDIVRRMYVTIGYDEYAPAVPQG